MVFIDSTGFFLKTLKRADREYYTGDDLYSALCYELFEENSLQEISFVKLTIKSRIYGVPWYSMTKVTGHLACAYFEFVLWNKKITAYIYDSGINEMRTYEFDQRRYEGSFSIEEDRILYINSDKSFSNLHLLIQSIRNYISKKGLMCRPSFSYLSGQTDINRLRMNNSFGIVEVSKDQSLLTLRLFLQGFKFQLFFILKESHG